MAELSKKDYELLMQALEGFIHWEKNSRSSGAAQPKFYDLRRKLQAVMQESETIVSTFHKGRKHDCC